MARCIWFQLENRQTFPSPIHPHRHRHRHRHRRRRGENEKCNQVSFVPPTQKNFSFFLFVQNFSFYHHRKDFSSLSLFLFLTIQPLFFHQEGRERVKQKERK